MASRSDRSRAAATMIRQSPTLPQESLLPANDPEFVDAAGLQARFGIKRGLGYALLSDGAIRGVSLRRRGHTRGKRLFAVGQCEGISALANGGGMKCWPD